jgi:hypothetical protein
LVPNMEDKLSVILDIWAVLPWSRHSQCSLELWNRCYGAPFGPAGHHSSAKI